MSALATKLLSAEQFSRRPQPADGSREELVRGEVTTMPPPSFRHGIVAGQVYFLIKTFLTTNRLGRVLGETGVRTENVPDTVRGPDVAYWSFEKLPRDQIVDVYPKVAADLCVEVRSPSNTLQSLREKAAEYLKAGVRMVWVVDSDDRSVTVYRKPNRGVTVWADQLVDGEEVLPGFQCKVSEFFEQE